MSIAISRRLRHLATGARLLILVLALLGVGGLAQRLAHSPADDRRGRAAAQAGPLGLAAAWVDGDVAVADVSGANWSYKIYSNSGVFKQTISHGLVGVSTGCAFDGAGNLYTTDLSHNRIVVFGAADPHPIIQTIDVSVQPGPGGNPESISFGRNGDFFVGNSGLYGGGPRTLQHYSAAGTWLQSWTPAPDSVGVDWIDLAGDQTTVFYASEGPLVKRYSAAGVGTQLADFAQGTGSHYALRLLPPGNGSGGLLVASGYSGIQQLDSSGAVVQTFLSGTGERLFGLNLDPNGQSFWTASLSTGNFYRANRTSGAIEVGPIATGSSSLGGICVKGELTSSPPATATPGAPTATPPATATPGAPTATHPPTALATATAPAGPTNTPGYDPRPTITAAPTTTVCTTSTPVAEGFEGGTLGSFAAEGAPGWAVTTTGPASGLYAAFAPDPAAVADQRLVLASGFAIPPGTTVATLSFVQQYDLERDFDGGVLEVTTDGGASWFDAEPNIVNGAYNSTLSSAYGNPLAGRHAWSGPSGGYVPVVVNLAPYAGQTVRFRFRLGSDSSNAGPGWTVDNIAVSVQTCSGTPPNGCQLPFHDVASTNTFYPYIHCLACYGIVSGYADGTFHPFANVTRGQLAKIIANAAGFSDPIAGQTFTDVPPGSAFYVFAELLVLHHALNGYGCGGPGEPCDSLRRPYFRPFANATRGQIAKIVASAAGLNDPVPPGQQTFADVPPSHPFWGWIEQLAGRGAISGYGCGGAGEPCDSLNRPYFRPSRATTRGQMSKIAGNTFFPGCYIARRK